MKALAPKNAKQPKTDGGVPNSETKAALVKRLS